MRTMYLDCNAGISGNMFLGALIDLGLPEQLLRNELGKLSIIIPQIAIRKTVKKGISAVLVEVESMHEHHHRHLSDIKQVINQSQLNEKIKQKAEQCFNILAEAEAKIHGVAIEDIHFHEVGALDAIVDVVGTCIGLDYFGVSDVIVSPIRVGFGTAVCAHGEINLPAPATLELLNGYEVFGGEIAGEWTTPTGAALLKTFCKFQGNIPSMRIQSIGWGAGSSERSIPNALRIIIGETGSDEGFEQQIILETNIDDMNPELYGYLGELLLEHGAKDYYFTPVFMKKNRPGVLVTVITPLDKVNVVENIILKETTTLGVRQYLVNRRCMERDYFSVRLGEDQIRIKTALDNNEVIKFSPEYEDCRKLSKKLNVPLKEIYEAAWYEAKLTLEKNQK